MKYIVKTNLYISPAKMLKAGDELASGLELNYKLLLEQKLIVKVEKATKRKATGIERIVNGN